MARMVEIAIISKIIDGCILKLEGLVSCISNLGMSTMRPLISKNLSLGAIESKQFKVK